MGGRGDQKGAEPEPDPGGARPAAPPWVQRMRPGCWYRISGDRPDLGIAPAPEGARFLVGNDPAADRGLNPPRSARERLRRALGRVPRAPWTGRSGFSSITEAWNSAVYASGLGPSGSMVLFGGGHDDYFGSDVHAFDLARCAWRRLCDGYVAGGPADYGAGARYPDTVYPDGSPLPPHTYDYVQYDAGTHRYLLLKGQVELGPRVEAAPVPHSLDLATLEWRRGPRHPWAILNSGGCSTWDAGRRLLWGHSGDAGGGNALLAYTPDGVAPDGTRGRWVHEAPNRLAGVADHNQMQIHPGRDRIVLAVHRRQRLYAIDPADPEAPPAELAAGGTAPRLRPYASLQYAPGLDALIYYSAAAGTRLHLLRASGGAPSWRWSEVPCGGRDPVADALALTRFPAQPRHTFGRFRVAAFEGAEIAVLVRHVDTPVYALRLPMPGEHRAL